MAFSDYNTTPGSNVTINGISIAENCPAGNMNGALRQLMADAKLFANGIPDTSTFVLKTGGAFTGNPVFSGRGGYLYHNDAANTSGRIFIQAAGGAAPTMANGDWLIEY